MNSPLCFPLVRAFAPFAILFCLLHSMLGQPPVSIHVGMMESTFKLVGENSTGTCFVLGRPDSESKGKFFYTLITADHVLSEMKGDSAVLVVHRLDDHKHWQRVEIPFAIRDKGRNLWLKHPDVDLAAMYIHVPAGVIPHGVIAMAMIFTDAEVAKFELGPGSELLCLGYPLGAEGNSEGFPILRSGKVASYPLLPSKDRKTFLFDFNVFKGNSGGPVYFYRENPVYGGNTHIETIFGVVGVVTNEMSFIQKIQQPYEQRDVETRLGLAGVIPATFIIELMESLAPPTGGPQVDSSKK